MPNPCIEKHFPELQTRHDQLVKEGLSEREAAIKAALEEHKKVFDQLQKFRKEIGLGAEKYVPFDNSKEVKEIKDRYNALIEGKNKSSEVEITLPIIEVTKKDLFSAQSRYDKANKKLKEAEKKIAETQSAQRGMFGGEKQKGMFAMGREEALKALQPLRDEVKNSKSSLDEISRKLEVQNNNKNTDIFKEEKLFSKNELSRIDAKEVYRQVREVADEPVDADQIALKYIADGGKVSEQVINEISGTAQRAKLNTGAKEFKSNEVKARDYSIKSEETLDDIAHSLWEKSNQEISERDIKDSLIDVINTHNTRLEAGQEYLERYSPEYAEKQQYEKFLKEHNEEIEKEEKDIKEWLESEGEIEFELMADENYVTKLIEQYEQQFKGEDKQTTSKTESGINKENSSNKSNEKEKVNLPDAEQNKKDEVLNTEKKGDTTNEPPNKISETSEGTETKEFDKLVTDIPDDGEIKKYLSGDTIKKYEVDKDGNEVELRNNQEIRERNLLAALEHGIETISKAKQLFGEQYVEKTLEYLEREKLSPENKALVYVSLENELAARILLETDNTLGLQKLQDLVRTKSQAFLRSSSLAINMGRLRKFGEAGYDITKVTDGFFTIKEREEKTAVEKLLQADADAINKEAEVVETLSVDEVTEQRIAEGVEKEINKIYEALPKGKRALANKAIKALEAVQKKLRGKAYDATIGVPIAIIDASITTIKNAIKLGVSIADAVELGIKKIKEKYGKDWAKEDDFRKDMIAGFKEEGVSNESEFNPKQYVKNSLIENGYGREVNIKTKDGVEKRNILDWKRLAGEEGSVEKIKARVEEQLKKDGYSEEDILEMSNDMIEEYNALRESIVNKGLTEIATRNKKAVTPDQKSAVKKLVEMYNYGLFDKNLADYETALSKTIGVNKLNEKRIEQVRQLGKAMEVLYSTKFKGKRLTEREMKAGIQVVEEKMRVLLNSESKEGGNTALRIADLARTYMDASQRMVLNNMKQAFENPLSGQFEEVFSSIGYTMGMPKELGAQRRKMSANLFKEMVIEKGVGYGDISSTFVNKGNLETYVNKMSDDRLFHAIASTALGKTTLDAVDSFYKSKITQQKFTYNLFKVLTSDRLINGKVEKAMSKQEAKNYIAEKLTGQSFKDAQTTAKEIIDKVNAGQEKKIFNDSPLFVDRLANDIVTASLVNGEKISAEMVEASYNSAYKAAGRGLGHVANNFISQGVGNVTGQIETKINNAIKEKQYNKAASLTILSIFFRNIANPFVGGGTNWVVLKAEKTGLGLVSGLGSMYQRGAKMDLTSETGIRNLETAMYESLKMKDKFIRGAIGGSVTVLTAMAFLGITTTDDYRKWRSKNMWAARYLDTLTPEILLESMATKDGKAKRYYEGLLNQNEQFDKAKMAMKAIVAVKKGDYSTAKAELGSLVGGSVGAPIPWRLVRDGQQVYQGITGGTPYKVNNTISQSFFESYYRGGLVDYLGFAPKAENLGMDLSVPEFKYLKDKGQKIVNITKAGLKPTDLKGVPLPVSDKQYDLVKVERENLIKQEVGKAMRSGFIYWSKGKRISKDKITTEELTPWLMTVSNNATKKAVEKVFGKQPIKKQKETVSSMAQ